MFASVSIAATSDASAIATEIGSSLEFTIEQRDCIPELSSWGRKKPM